MKKWSVPIVCLVLFLAATVGYAAVPYEDSFESWANPNVADGWTASEFGGGPGDVNHIYDSGQGMSSGGDGTNYRSIYRDVTVSVGRSYKVSVWAISNAMSTAGQVDPGYVRLWVQYDREDGTVIGTHGQSGTQVPGAVAGTTESLLGATWKNMYFSSVAPTGSHHARVIVQVLGGKGGGAVFRGLNFLDVTETTEKRMIGDSFVRNTEWTEARFSQERGVALGWTAYWFGADTGDYNLRITGGSAQGVSCGGNGTNFKQVYRDLDVAAGGKYSGTIDVISNSTNTVGAVDPTYVKFYLQFLDDKGSVLTTQSSDGATLGISDLVYKTVEPFKDVTAPEKTVKARVILRVQGGTGGGTVFDNFKLQ
jgi:hypothetical protein